MEKKEYTIYEIAEMSGIYPEKIRNLIKRGYIKATKKKVVFEKNHTIAYGKNFSQKKKTKIKHANYKYMIDIDDWLAIPTFIRENWRKESLKKVKSYKKSKDEKKRN